MPAPHYPLPPYLQGRITQTRYDNWLRVKSWALLKRDRKRKRPYATPGSITMYKDAVQAAVWASGVTDPYTGDALAWELIDRWDPARAKGDSDYIRQFFPMPTIDHIDPYADTLAFEICSWQVNLCKSFQDPPEFLDMCRKVVANCGSGRAEGGGAERFPALYILPPFLDGVCTQKTYSKWLLCRAKELYIRDKKQKRPCAANASRSLYRKAIHRAVGESGALDPYTGDAMAWDRIGTWDTTKGKDNHDIFKTGFALLPTVDHLGPDAQELDFEICSWLVNCCKSSFTRDEFIGICKKVAAHRPPAI
jgi:hypothetical protein